jgi:flagellar basal-body rod protein FlgF
MGAAMNTRSFVVNATSGTDFTPGGIEQTGRSLDVAIEGKGWLSVQRADGTEAYTRNGSLKMSENGILQTASGLNVLGDGGPITIPPNVVISIGADGTISTVNDGDNPGPSTGLGRLKLTNPEEANLVRGTDGLFNLGAGGSAPIDENVKVVNGALEGSNVSVVQSMVNMISLARQFEVQITMLKNAERNDEKATQLLQLN